MLLCATVFLRVYYHESTWYNILPKFKNGDTDGNQRIHTLYIWNSNHFGENFCLVTEVVYQLCQRTGWGLLHSSDSLRINARGFTLRKSWTTAKRQNDYLLNVMFPWMSHGGDSFSPWWPLITARTVSALEHICILISHQLPVRYSAFFYFSSILFSDRKQIASQSRQRVDNPSIQNKSFTLRSWRFISYFTGGV